MQHILIGNAEVILVKTLKARCHRANEMVRFFVRPTRFQHEAEPQNKDIA